MGMYYAIVRNFHNRDRIAYRLCGRLWAQRYRDALAEAREYQEELNGGIPEDFTPSYEPYYIVVPTFHGDVHKNYKFQEFKYRRVTKRPTLRDSLFRLQPIEALGEDPR